MAYCCSYLFLTNYYKLIVSARWFGLNSLCFTEEGRETLPSWLYKNQKRMLFNYCDFIGPNVIITNVSIIRVLLIGNIKCELHKVTKWISNINIIIDKRKKIAVKIKLQWYEFRRMQKQILHSLINLFYKLKLCFRVIKVSVGPITWSPPLTILPLSLFFSPATNKR